MKKNWLALLLAGVLCFNLTGCQSTGESDSKASAKEVSSTGKGNEAYLDEDSDTADYTEITMVKAKFMVPNRITSTGDGIEDIVRFSDSETYEVKGRFCEISLLDDDTAKVAENIENYYKEYFDVTVEIDEKNCIEAHDGEKAKYIYSSATYNDNNASFAYINNADCNVLFYIIDKDNLFTEDEKNTMLKSLDEYSGSDYSYGVNAELETMTSIEDMLAEQNAEKEAKEAEEAALLAEKFNNPLCAFELTIAGETLKLPMWYSDLEAAGWTFDGDPGKEMSAHSSEGWHEWEKNGVKLSATMTNFSVNSAPYSECIITEIGYSLDSDNSEEDIVELPSDIQMHKSTYDDIINAYGEPYYTGEPNETLYMIKYEFDSEHKVSFTFHVENDVVYAVDLECEEMLEGINNDVSSERPEILDTYQAPSKLSDNPYDTTLELDSVVYQLPCPTEVFIENGWQIKEGNDLAVSPGVGENCTLVKNDMSISVTLKCPTKDAVIAEHTYVTAVEITVYDGSKFPLSLNGGVTVGEKITADELTALFETMEIDADTSREDMQFFFMSSTEESDTYIEYFIIINDGVIGSIGIDNNVWFER